jgi:hypothetical protein
MFITDLRGDPVYLRPEPDDDIGDGVSYRDLALVVRGGVPALEIVKTLSLDHAVLDRLKADGTVDADLKPIQPIMEYWGQEHVDIDTALIRLLARQWDVEMMGQSMFILDEDNQPVYPEPEVITDPEEVWSLGIPTVPRKANAPTSARPPNAWAGRCRE